MEAILIGIPAWASHKIKNEILEGLVFSVLTAVNIGIVGMPFGLLILWLYK